MSDNTDDSAAREDSWRDGESPRWAFLDPAGEPRHEVFSTAYVADELLVDEDEFGEIPPGEPDAEREDPLRELRDLARQVGWTIERADLEDPDTDGDERQRGLSRSVRVRIRVADSGVTGVVAETPDAWQLLRQARRDKKAHGISLNHLISTDSWELNPYKANPYKANPYKANPYKANPYKANAAAVGLDSYACPGFGGRQPVTYLGPDPQPSDSVKRRPVVAILDTGCGKHPWFHEKLDVIIPPYMPNGDPIGITRGRDPETWPSGQPLDGAIADAAGHGTFIAGIVRQHCPDAQILPVRVSDRDGTIIENELIGTLGRLLHLVTTSDKAKVDVLVLSFSYYHETPDHPDTVSELAKLLQQFRDQGVVIVCSAGNEATDRPTYPAALGEGSNLHVSVGALNPSNHSVALFSNVGDWVRTYAPGVSLVSTLPTKFNGGVQAGMSDPCHGRHRETLDIDDFRGGFAVWSGTSFAAPVVAGCIARDIARGHAAEKATKRVVAEMKDKDHSRLR